MMGIYGVVDPEIGEVVYVGSSTKDLQKLEWNHRNYYKFKDGYESRFRKNLRQLGEDFQFHWIQEPRDISRLQCEIEEGALIRWLRPMYNDDKYPYETSVRKGRMEQI